MGEKYFSKIGSELVVGVYARQAGQHESGVPLEDLVLVVQQADKEIQMRIEPVRTLLADEAEGLGAAILDAGLVGFQALRISRTKPGFLIARQRVGLDSKPPGGYGQAKPSWREIMRAQPASQPWRCLKRHSPGTGTDCPRRCALEVAATICPRPIQRRLGTGD